MVSQHKQTGNAFAIKMDDAKDTVRLWLDAWHDFDIENEHTCGCGEKLIGAELALAHYYTDGSEKCVKKAHEAKVVAQDLTVGDINTPFYCQVPGFFWAGMHHDGAGIKRVKAAIKRPFDLRHPGLMEPREAMVTMLKPQPAVAELQTALVALYYQLATKVVSIQPDKRFVDPTSQLGWHLGSAFAAEAFQLSRYGGQHTLQAAISELRQGAVFKCIVHA